MEIIRTSKTHGVPEKAPLGVSRGHQRNLAIAKALARASVESLGVEIDDYSADTLDVVGLLPEDAKLIDVKVFQDAADDGTSVSTVDVTVDGGSVLDSAVSLDDGGSATQSATVSDAEHDEDAIVRVDVGGESDDGTPPGGYVQVEYRLAKNRYRNRKA